MDRLHEPGAGSARTRRRIAAFLAAGILAGAGARAAGPEPQISVREDRGVYVVTARFEVPQPPAAAAATLADFERIPRFMPDLKTSIVRTRFEGGAIVEQEAVTRVLMFSKQIHLVLDVRVDDEGIRFNDTCGRSFTRYQGTWRFARHGTATLVRYDLEAQPAFDVPGFLLTRLLRRDAKDMIERLRVEIAARVGR